MYIYIYIHTYIHTCIVFMCFAEGLEGGLHEVALRARVTARTREAVGDAWGISRARI